MQKAEQVQKSLVTTYKKRIWNKFTQALQEFDLIQDGDKIAVCISGGKDSFMLAACFEQLKRHGKQNFEVKYIVMDPGYDKDLLEKTKDNLLSLGIDATIFTSTIFKDVSSMGKTACYMCAKMRRGHLYSYAKELGCNKIALGHHLDDVCETTLMSVLYSGTVATMLPKLKSQNFEGIELIRPLYNVEEKSIKTFWNTNEVSFINCACRFDCSAPNENQTWHDPNIGKRKEMKLLLAELVKKNPNAKKNILNATKNINLDACIGWQKDGKTSSFLDEY